MQEFKKRFVSFLWTIPYLLIALVIDFILQNIGLLNLNPTALLFLTAALREVGKAVRKHNAV